MHVLPACVQHVMCLPGGSAGHSEEGVNPLRLEQDDCYSPHEFLELNLGPLQESRKCCKLLGHGFDSHSCLLMHTIALVLVGLGKDL